MPALSTTRATREAAESAGIAAFPTEAETLAAVGLPVADAPACFAKRATMPAALCAGCTWAPACPVTALPPPPSLP